METRAKNKHSSNCRVSWKFTHIPTQLGQVSFKIYHTETAQLTQCSNHHRFRRRVHILKFDQIDAHPYHNQAPRKAQEAAKKEGDHFALLNYFDAYLEKAKKEEVRQLGDDSFINCTALETAAKVWNHFFATMENLGIEICDVKKLPKGQYYSNIMMALLSGYLSQVAHRGENGDYFTLETNEVVCLHQSVCLGDKPEWVIYNDCISTITGMSTSRTFLHTVTRLHVPLLVEIAPRYCRLLPDSDAKLKLELLVEEKGRNLKERGTRVRRWKIIDEHV